MHLTDLGTFGGDSSTALGINDAGQVLGVSMTDNLPQRTFITGPDGVGMTDLASLVDLPTGFIYFHATAINNQGQLAAVGGLQVIPEPETYAMLLLGLWLIGFFARRRATA